MDNNTAIIILNYKSWKETIEEAEHVKLKCGIHYKDILIIDNASPNDSAKKLKEYCSSTGTQFFSSSKNNGYASGNNIGLRAAHYQKYRYAWILNNDIVIDDSETLSKLLRIFTIDDSVGVANPDILDPDGNLYNRDSKRYSFYDLTFGINSYRKKGREVEDKGGYAYIYRPQGCCMLVDLDKMNEIGYLDEHTFLYNEELILAEKLRNKKYKCALSLECSIVHNHSKTIKSNFDKKKIAKINTESFKYYLEKYRHFNSIQVWICCLFNFAKWMVLD